LGLQEKIFGCKLRIYWETGENYIKKSKIICALANYYGAKPKRPKWSAFVLFTYIRVYVAIQNSGTKIIVWKVT
jgi:hypothetical protein